jgi:hypothetical protein
MIINLVTLKFKNMELTKTELLTKKNNTKMTTKKSNKSSKKTATKKQTKKTVSKTAPKTAVKNDTQKRTVKTVTDGKLHVIQLLSLIDNKLKKSGSTSYKKYHSKVVRVKNRIKDNKVSHSEVKEYFKNIFKSIKNFDNLKVNDLTKIIDKCNQFKLKQRGRSGIAPTNENFKDLFNKL